MDKFSNTHKKPSYVGSNPTRNVTVVLAEWSGNGLKSLSRQLKNRFSRLLG